MRSGLLTERSHRESILAAAVLPAPRRPTFERALQLATVALVLLTVVAAGSILDWMSPARKLRWLALLVLVALAVVYAARGRARVPLASPVAAAAFVGLAIVSTAWSATEGLTLGRALAFALVIIAAAAMAIGAAARPAPAVETLLYGVLAGALPGARRRPEHGPDGARGRVADRRAPRDSPVGASPDDRRGAAGAAPRL